MFLEATQSTSMAALFFVVAQILCLIEGSMASLHNLPSSTTPSPPKGYASCYPLLTSFFQLACSTASKEGQVPRTCVGYDLRCNLEATCLKSLQIWPCNLIEGEGLPRQKSLIVCPSFYFGKHRLSEEEPNNHWGSLE